MSRKGALSRWGGGKARYSERMVEDDRQLRNKKGQWRRVADECTEHDYCQRRRERPGFHRGARLKNQRTPTDERTTP